MMQRVAIWSGVICMSFSAPCWATDAATSSAIFDDPHQSTPEELRLERIHDAPVSVYLTTDLMLAAKAKYGYIHQMKKRGKQYVAMVHLAQYFNGDRAEEEARRDRKEPWPGGMYMRDAYKKGDKLLTLLIDEDVTFIKTHSDRLGFYRIGYLHDYLYDRKIDHSYASNPFGCKLWSDKYRERNSTGFWFLTIDGKIRYVTDAFFP
ncbi:MAG TPA: hypothetical protein V6D00_11805 [Pantanalinema sp.]